MYEEGETKMVRHFVVPMQTGWSSNSVFRLLPPVPRPPCHPRNCGRGVRRACLSSFLRSFIRSKFQPPSRCAVRGSVKYASCSCSSSLDGASPLAVLNRPQRPSVRPSHKLHILTDESRRRVRRGSFDMQQQQQQTAICLPCASQKYCLNSRLSRRRVMCDDNYIEAWNPTPPWLNTYCNATP